VADIGTPAGAYLGKAFQAACASLLQGADAAPGPGPAREDHLAISAGQQAPWPSGDLLRKKEAVKGVTVWSRKIARPVFGNSLER
jgi:hypothetical protein